jgi:hypothetical protein
MADHQLSLPEAMMLLTLHDETGKVELSSFWTGRVNYPMAVAGAVLNELVLLDRVRIDDTGKTPMVEVSSSMPTGSAFIDEWLLEMSNAAKRCSAQHWVSVIAGTKDLRGRLARALADRDILEVDEERAWVFFSREVYPQLDPEPERELRERLRKAVLFDDDDLDARTCAILALGKATGFHTLLFSKDELKARAQRIDAIIEGRACADAVQAVVAQAVAAAMTLLFVAAVITS